MTRERLRPEAQLLLDILHQLTGDVMVSLPDYNLQQDSPSLEKFVELAVKNGVASFIYRQIKGSNVLPDKIVESLKLKYRQMAISNLGQLAETLKILDILKIHNITAIPLKGVFDARRVFGDLGVYPSSDIDLLLPKEQLSIACSTLNQYGYFAVENIAEADLLSSHYHVIYRKEQSCVELHWTLVKRYFNVPQDFWWRGVTEINFEGRGIIKMAPDKYLLYLIFRLFDHQFSPLKFWIHLSAYISNETNFDWKKMFDYAEQYGMKRLVVFTLRFAHDMLGTQLPTRYICRKFLGYSMLCNRVYAQNFSERSKPHVSMLLFSFFLLPPGMFIRVMLSMIFASKAEIRLRYGLDPKSKYVHVYILLNPILMLIRRSRGRTKKR